MLKIKMLSAAVTSDDHNLLFAFLRLISFSKDESNPILIISWN